MLTEEMKVWHGVVIAVVSLVLQACLLAAVNYLLSRHMAKENERILKKARLQVPRPSPAHYRPPAAKEMKETRAERSTPVPEPRYLHDSDTSSDSSDSSDGSPPTHQATKDVNYTQVVFSAPGGQRNDSVLDYENIEEATDYINVKPKSHKPSFWTFVNPGVFEPVEYPSGRVNSRLFNGV
ncbi:regulator of hemoglobinization and erythroid cell expansion protein [Eubalaena glacialis]|uniref:regulator of hemoglobinization and erythroid cell expansion protein n=1 Tax=Eubalaena glacialis TaxID=27606 RepID=UPI002A599095|nr:regulator of hemoglobinization and erythroid cell expansion protein [Eubalaena glacialis]